MKAKKHLGQNFLNSNKLAKKIADSAGLDANDIVLEIGPGTGSLTKELLNSGARVFAVEKDTELIPVIEERFAGEIDAGQLILINDDVLAIDIADIFTDCIGEYKLVANIPYYITGKIIRKFLTSHSQPIKMILLVQKEVAQRIIASDGKESMLSISVKAYGKPRIVMKVPSRFFTPEPKVDSAVIEISEISRNKFDLFDIDENRFFKILRSGFAHKRKKLIGNLGGFADKKVLENALVSMGLSKDTRAENLFVDEWFKLAQAIENE